MVLAVLPTRESRGKRMTRKRKKLVRVESVENSFLDKSRRGTLHNPSPSIGNWAFPRRKCWRWWSSCNSHKLPGKAPLEVRHPFSPPPTGRCCFTFNSRASQGSIYPHSDRESLHIVRCYSNTGKELKSCAMKSEDLDDDARQKIESQSTWAGGRVFI